jgi:hypothetical protein
MHCFCYRAVHCTDIFGIRMRNSAPLTTLPALMFYLHCFCNRAGHCTDNLTHSARLLPCPLLCCQPPAQISLHAVCPLRQILLLLQCSASSMFGPSLPLELAFTRNCTENARTCPDFATSHCADNLPRNAQLFNYCPISPSAQP